MIFLYPQQSSIMHLPEYGSRSRAGVEEPDRTSVSYGSNEINLAGRSFFSIRHCRQRRC